MPTFHFNVVNGTELADVNGHELPDICSARREAVAYAGALLSESDASGFWNGEEWKMEVTDESGAILWVLIFNGWDSTVLSRQDS